MNKLVIGVDPGKDGAIAYYGPHVKGLYKMPEEHELHNFLLHVRSEYTNEETEVVAYLEKVGGYVGAKQPGAAMFNFGRNYGFVLGTLQTMGIRTILVRPAEWQKGIPGLRKRGKAVEKKVRKRAICDEACRRWPMIKVPLYGADAVMISEWGMRQP